MFLINRQRVVHDNQRTVLTLSWQYNSLFVHLRISSLIEEFQNDSTENPKKDWNEDS